jgi:hypothetical protein
MSQPEPSFRISKSGTGFEVMHNSGAYGLSLASDGNGIFRLTTSGTYTLLSSTSSNGFYVESFNKQATDGNFYGICYPVSSGWWHVCERGVGLDALRQFERHTVRPPGRER